jgi:hypothetical protein
VQVVAPKLEIDLPLSISRHCPRASASGRAQDAAVEAAGFRFDLEKGPLIRVTWRGWRRRTTSS